MTNKERCRKYYYRHQEELQAKSREKYKEDKEYREKTLSKNQEYYWRNRDKILQQKKDYLIKNGEGIREGRKIEYFQNREARLEKMKEYEKTHRIERRAYRAKNKEKIREKGKEWRHNNPGKVRLYDQKKRALRKMAGFLPLERIQRVIRENIETYGVLTCIYCEKPTKSNQDSLEHKQPLFRGGTHDFENLAIACRSCNSSKGTKTFEEYTQIDRIEECLI